MDDIFFSTPLIKRLLSHCIFNPDFVAIVEVSVSIAYDLPRVGIRVGLQDNKCDETILRLLEQIKISGTLGRRYHDRAAPQPEILRGYILRQDSREKRWRFLSKNSPM